MGDLVLQASATLVSKIILVSVISLFYIFPEGLVAPGPQRTKATGHASSPSYGVEERTEEAVSTGKDFQPASWKPPSAENTETSDTK